jgi:hypothetical protein
VTGEPDLTPFSLEELGLSPEEIAALGLSEATPEPPAPEPVAPPPAPAPEPAKATSDEPDLTPFSLEELGLSPEEIAALGLSEATPEPPAPEPVTPPPAPTPEPVKAASDEPDLTPFSLEELGLSPEEIAALEGTAVPAEESASVAPEAPAATPAPAADEPDMTPFSLADLGLSPEEIAALEGTAVPAEESASVAPEVPAETAAPAADEPDLTPFSLEELGLSPEEIAALEGGALNTEPALGSRITTEELNVGLDFGQELDGSLDFDMVDEAPVEQVARATRTAPRIEEPPPPISPEDAAFEPESLETLDNIWDVAPPPVAEAVTSDTTRLAPKAPAAEPPARVVLPPRQERPVREERAPRERPVREERPRRERPVREERSSSGSSGSRAGWGRSRDNASSVGSRGVASLPKADLAPTSFIPTGDEVLDEYLRQVEAEPDNLGLRLAVARISAQTGRADVMAAQYRQLIKTGRALDQVVDEVQDLLAGVDDTSTERQLYRTLGDAYSRQGRLREAVAAYGHTV